ncbi:unnamed protein product, partial [Pelagomonas calceolata]
MAVHRAALKARSGSPVPLQARRASREVGRLDRIQSSIRQRNGRARVVGQRRVSVAVLWRGSSSPPSLASGSAAGGGERAMRCRERAAFGEAPTSRTRPGTSRRSI